MGKKSQSTKKPAKKSTKKKTVSASATNEAAVSPEAAPKKPTLKSLLKKKFDHWTPENVYLPEPDVAYENNFAAPPANEGKTAGQIQSLLSRRFDLSATPPEKPTPKKAGGKQPEKTVQKKEPKASPKNDKKAQPAGKQKPAAVKTPVSTEELIGRKFDAWMPEKPYTPEPDAAYESNFAAPPAFEEQNKGLLFKQFDLSVIDTPPETPAEPEPVKQEAPPVAPKPKKEPVPIQTLIKLQFETWVPEKPYSPEADEAYSKDFSAPPAFEGIDRGLLFKQFDLSIPDEKKPLEQPVIAEVPAESAAPEKPAPAEVTPAPAPVEPEAPKAEIEAPVAKPIAEEPIPGLEPPIVTEPAEPPTETPAVQAPVETAPAPETPPETTPPTPVEKAPVIAEKPVVKAAEPKKTTGKEKAAEPPKPPKDDNMGGSGMPPEPPEPPTSKKEPSMNPGLKLLIVSLGVIFALVIAASISNMQNYYVKQTDKGIEIWRGDFSPRGKDRIVQLYGAKAPEAIDDVYSREQALTLAFNYYMTKADALPGTDGDLIDFKAIINYLEKAKEYAVTGAQQELVTRRLNEIDFMMLSYKADVSAGKKTEEGYKEALGFLKEAKQLKLGPEQKEQLLQKNREFTAALDNLKAKRFVPKAKVPAKASEKAPADQTGAATKPQAEQKTGPASDETPAAAAPAPAHH